MRERLDKILEQLKELNDKIGKPKRRIILIVVIAVIVAIIVLIKLMSVTTYEVLYTGVSSDEQIEILGALQELGIESKSYDNGTIEVPSGQADSARAQLAMEGHPNSGMSYDIFSDNVGITSTDFEKETYKLYELQDRLAATIKYFNGVRDARVTIATGEKSDYVLKPDDADTDTTASVTVIMKDGGSPTDDQVEGIQKLVSSSVPGMSSDQVSVIDGDGNYISDNLEGDLADSSTLSSLKIELKEQDFKSSGACIRRGQCESSGELYCRYRQEGKRAASVLPF